MSDYTCVDYSVLIERLRECTPLMRTAADAIERLAKPVESRWVQRLAKEDPDILLAYYFCDQCGTPQYYATPFCGYCGAHMTGVIEQEVASSD